MLVILGMTFISCSNEQEDIKNDSEIQMKQTTIKVLPNEVNDSFLEFEFVRTDKGLDFTQINVISYSQNKSGYYHCGGGVFTNGESTYMYIARSKDFPMAIQVWDDFINEYYYYTVHWCSCTCTN